MDVLYHLLKLKPNGEVRDVVYCDNIPVWKKWSQNAQLFSEKKDRSYRLNVQNRLSLSLTNTQLLKGETGTGYPEAVDVFH